MAIPGFRWDPAIVDTSNFTGFQVPSSRKETSGNVQVRIFTITTVFRNERHHHREGVEQYTEHEANNDKAQIVVPVGSTCSADSILGIGLL